MSNDAIFAATRFGLGQRPGESVPTDPRRWLRDQLTAPDPIGLTGPTTSDGLIARRQDRKESVPFGTPTRARAIWDAERVTLLAGLVGSDAPFRERLVWFWANHFTVSLRRDEVQAIAGAYVREAIRPHVTGRFVDMLTAVMTHPAMLIYLDNAQSIGPNSVVGQRKPERGLNENLARECLELHTLSPASGYSQADVTAAARVLTGWSVDREAAVPGFRFRAQAHEPGPQTVMGQTFPPGQDGGLAMLAWLGTHPASYAHIARKLVGHFGGDRPQASQAVARLLAETGGDLRAASATLIDLPACWSGTMVRTPLDYVVAVARATGLAADAKLADVLAALGEPLLSPPLPNGFSDAAEAWDDGEALLRRVDWAWTVAGRLPDLDPIWVLDGAIGPRAGAPLRMAVRTAGSRQEALALLLASPEMMRR